MARGRRRHGPGYRDGVIPSLLEGQRRAGLARGRANGLPPEYAPGRCRGGEIGLSMSGHSLSIQSSEQRDEIIDAP